MKPPISPAMIAMKMPESSNTVQTFHRGCFDLSIGGCPGVALYANLSFWMGAKWCGVFSKVTTSG